MPRRRTRTFLLPLALSAALAGCGRAVPSPGADRTGDAGPYWPTAGWRTSFPERQGMDSEILADLMGRIREQGHRIDSVTVVRHGYIVADAAVFPYRAGSKHAIHSCTKSIVSALIGIAIAEGDLAGVGQPVLELFPSRSPADPGPRKKELTVEHLLTMTSGLSCRDSYLYHWEGLEQMRRSADWVRFVLELPMAAAPGSTFEYCNGASFLLAAILQEATGTSALAYAGRKLFGPLGITDVDWPANPRGIQIGWGEIRMAPRDMAKIGYLYLRNGAWDGRQVVPAAWIAASTRKHVAATLHDGYGYQWWVDRADGLEVWIALGYRGQFIFVVPERDLVAVFTSDLPDREFRVPWSLLNEFILPATGTREPLPENPEGAAALEAGIRDLARP